MRLTASLALFAALFMPQVAEASCSCRGRQPLDALNAAKFAVLARVVATRTVDSFTDTVPVPLPPSRVREVYTLRIFEVTLVVEARFKGAPADTLRVITEYDSCTYFGPNSPPKLGERHLLFFYQPPAAEPLGAWDCGGSMAWAQLKPEMQAELYRRRRSA